MSEIEQANGIEIPAEVVEAAARAGYEDGAVRKMNVGPPWNELEDRAREAWRPHAEHIVRTALDAWGATVEQKTVAGEPLRVQRLVTPWREVP